MVREAVSVIYRSLNNRGLLLFLFLSFWGTTATSTSADSGASPVILSGTTLKEVALDECLAAVKPGTIIVLGERHWHEHHRTYQLMVMSALRSRGLPVSVGMEFIPRPNQPHVDQFRQGLMTEAEFLSAVGWKRSFDHYRDQILFPAPAQNTVALNVARRVTAQIAKKGIEALSAEDRDQLPSDFATAGRGNDRYFQRFKSVMPHDIAKTERVHNVFMAQSAWDDTMAWTAVEYIQKHPQEVLVIVVGDFHVSYGGGLPDRLKKRGAADIVTISMPGNKPGDRESAITPHGPFGPRADWIWLAPDEPRDPQ